jgi:heme-degrading monooxygenase HmoA
LITRIWRTRVLAEREAAYEAFARERSLPMFREQAGFLGVLFAKSSEERAVITFWSSRDDLRRPEDSSSYQETVASITQAGLLDGPSSVEVFETHGHALSPAILER